jgi:hypothetical protein
LSQGKPILAGKFNGEIDSSDVEIAERSSDCGI